MLKLSPYRIVLATAVVFAALMLLMPSLLPEGTLPERFALLKIRLGLDLQGGSSLLLEIDESSVRHQRMESLEGAVRGVLRGDNLGYRDLDFNTGRVRFTLRGDTDPATVATKLRRELTETRVEHDGARFTLSYDDARWVEEIQKVMGQTIEVIRRRIDEVGTNEPSIQQQGRLRVLVQLPGLDDPERLKKLIGRTAQMNFHLVDERGLVGDRARPGSLALPSAEGELLAIERRVRVSGEHLVDSQATFQDNQPVVSFRFDQSGGRRFGRVTADNVNKRLAIVLDGTVISAPNIEEAILGGSGIIRGGFTVGEAQDLSLLLRAGALPAPITILEERSVGPSLGADSLAGGEMAALVGLLAVSVLMVASYGVFGLIAIIALGFNLVLLMALLSSLQATLTLPGLAGIALTIGMSVDANVLIFERIREELRTGKVVPMAINAGFDRAFVTIVDANVTTLIAAVCLYIFGLGAIRGFAVTLTFGILASMFTAIMLTRIMTTLWYNRVRPANMRL